MTEPREMTDEEARDRFLEVVAAHVQYWGDTVPADMPALERCDGLAFSILAVLDGANCALPSFLVMPWPHETDAAFLKNQGENWFPSEVDIAGDLHDTYSARFSPLRRTE